MSMSIIDQFMVSSRSVGVNEMVMRGDYVYIEDGASLFKYDVATYTQKATASYGGVVADGLDGYLYSTKGNTGSGQISKVNPDTLALVSSITVSHDYLNAAVSDGTYLYVLLGTGYNYYVSKINLATATEVKTASVSNQYARSLAIDLAHGYLMVGGQGAYLNVLRTSDLSVVKNIAAPNYVQCIAGMYGNKALVLMNATTALYILDTAALTLTSTGLTISGVYQGAYDGFKSFVVSNTNGTGPVWVVDADTYVITDTIQTNPGSTISPYGIYGVYCDRNGRAYTTSGLGSGWITAIQLSAPPPAPTITEPVAASYVDLASGLNVTATLHSADGANLNAYALRAKTVGAAQYSYWSAANSAFQSTVAWNPTNTAPEASLSVLLPPSSLIANGQQLSVSVAAQESLANMQGPFATDVSFNSQAAPSVAITTPTGTVTDTSQPTIAWSLSTPSGAVQTQYHVIVETGAYGTVPGSGVQVADSTVVSGEDLSWQVPSALTNGLQYRAFVQVWQTGGQPSAWAYSTWTLTLSPPAYPGINIAINNVPPQALVTVSLSQVTIGTFDHTNTTIQLQASADGETDWTDVRGASNLAVGTDDTVLVTDNEAPARTSYYRARAYGVSGNNVLVSDWSPAVQATYASSTAWLSDPIADIVIPVLVAKEDTRVAGIQQAVTPVLGSKDPVVSQDVWQGLTGTIQLYVHSSYVRQVTELLESGATLLYRRISGALLYFRTTGPITTAEVTRTDGHRLISSAWIERARP